MSNALALEYANDGIIVIPVHPGEVDTEMSRNSAGPSKEGQEMLDKITIKPAESARLQLEVSRQMFIILF